MQSRAWSQLQAGIFTDDQARLVSELSEVILPTTDTPGAKAVGVPNFIDKVIKECYTKESQEHYIAGLTTFDEEAKKTYGDRFIYCKPKDQLAMVKKANETAIKNKKDNPDEKRSFFYMTKELTVLGYFNSETGATKVLQYETVPGAYKGCIPLSEAGNGKTWATWYPIANYLALHYGFLVKKT